MSRVPDVVCAGMGWGCAQVGQPQPCLGACLGLRTQDVTQRVSLCRLRAGVVLLDNILKPAPKHAHLSETSSELSTPSHSGPPGWRSLNVNSARSLLSAGAGKAAGPAGGRPGGRGRAE